MDLNCASDLTPRPNDITSIDVDSAVDMIDVDLDTTDENVKKAEVDV